MIKILGGWWGGWRCDAAEKAEYGMADMSKGYDETERELWIGAGDREHD